MPCSAVTTSTKGNRAIVARAPQQRDFRMICPTLLGHVAELTCDSDGKLARFISDGQAKRLLELNALREGEPYLIGLFLSGAYSRGDGQLAQPVRCYQPRAHPPGHGWRVVRGDTNADELQQ